MLAASVGSPWTDASAVDGETYTYFVLADNGSYCTIAATGPTVSLEAPGATTGSASIANRGTGQFDIRADALAASGTVFKYQYQLSTDGTWRDVPADNWLTTLGSPGAAYGESIGVIFRACRNDSDAYCGDPSAATSLVPVNTRVTVATCDATTGTAPVITLPTNSGAVTATYTVSYLEFPWLLYGGYGSADDPVPSTAISMRVTATVNGYVDPGYGEFACTT